MAELGFDFESIVRPVEEIYPPELQGKDIAIFLAKLKAKAYEDLAHQHIIITADTIVLADQRVLGKPENVSMATSMLKTLSGKEHSVITGVCILHKGEYHSFAEETLVCFKQLTDEEIQYYIDRYKPFDKAGAYAIQEWIGMSSITSIKGDYYNVVGLPCAKLYQALSTFYAETKEP